MRNRTLYSADAIMISKGVLPPTVAHTSGDITELLRVQSANYGATINRTDINQFGQLARIDSLAVDSPNVTYDMDYYVHDGYNEAKMGFTLSTGFNISALSGLLVSQPSLNSGAAGVLSGRNLFIFTTPDGTDANLPGSYGTGLNNSILTIGNAQLTNYSVNAAVGSIPTASVSYEGFNGVVTAYTYNTGKLASVDVSGVPTTASYTLPPGQTGTGITVTATRPGDILLSLGDPAMFTDLVDDASGSSAHIQSFSISVPLGRTTLQRLGSNFGYAKEIDFPVNIDVSISAVMSDFKNGSVYDTLMANALNTLQITMRNTAGVPKISYMIKGAQIVSESFTSSIGSNKQVDITFTAQVGGPSDNSAGLFISGATTATPFL